MRQAMYNDAGQYFFLPPFADFGGGVIDFLRLHAVPYSTEHRPTLVGTRILSLTREMASELAARFVRYMSRLGQPAYDGVELVRAVEGARPLA